MTQPPNVPNGQPFDPNKIPTDPQQAAAWAQQQQAAAWQQHAAWQQQAAQEAQEEAHQEYLEQQAAEAKKSGGLGLRGIISIVVAVVAVGAGGWGLWQKIQTDQALKEGNCIVLSGTADDASEKKIECDKEPFSWKVASIAANEAGCPTEDTVPYTVTSKSRRGASRTDKVACLAPNLHEGKCYQEVDDALTPYKEVECTAGNAKISKVIEEANATCEAPSEPWSLPTAKRTYCVEPVA